MRKNRVIEQNRCYHLVSRLAHRAFFLDDEEKDRAVALMRRVEAGVQASMSYCINRTVSISSDPFDSMKKVLAQFGDSCKVPEIECKCCDWYTKKDGSDAASITGIYSRDTRKITYCWNNHKRKRSTDSDMRKTLAHELTHALQHCAGYGTNCKESIKKEIEARICAKECSTFDGCLASALESSCIMPHCVTAAEAMKAYEEVKTWYDAKRTKGHYKPGGFCYFGK